LNARYQLSGYDILLYESNINFLDNHRALKNKGFFRFNKAKYTNYLKLDFKNYQSNLSGYPLIIINDFYNQLSPIYKINIGTFDYPYYVRE
jgi:hypothetical protein